ncbi:MAG: methylase involved in ubiquinone/menaquinone biosynthesi [Alphaproteobacteria bacterium]|nr:MAG: methylase involved in ubiquinone/menaquinone biosynthesi [Alphaproteobacteria bacterium]
MEEGTGLVSRRGDSAFAPLYGAARTLLAREGRWRSVLASHVRPQPHDLIVDMPCGGGELAQLLASLAPAARILGVDENAAAIANAHARPSGRSPRLSLVHAAPGDLAQILGPRSATKVIVTLTDIHRAVEKTRRLNAAREIIDPLGALFVLDYGAQRTPLMRSLRKAAQAFRDAPPSQAHDTVAPLIRSAGFVAVEEAASWPTPLGAVSLYRARAS